MPLEALKRMPKRFFPLILFIPFLIGCHNVKPISVSEEVFSYESLSIDEIPSYNEPVFDETGTAIPTESPHYKVTIEENPEVVWDDSQSNLRTGNKTLDFYNINDIHGTVDESGNYTGIRKISSYLQQQASQNKNGYVFTSSGDSWQGSADSNLTRGALMDSWLEYVQCSAMAIGNHEFDWTIDTLTYNDTHTKFPFLACNILRSDNNQPVDWARPFTTITRNGVHIGIIGAIGEGITSSITASYVRGLTFVNPLSYVSQWSQYLKQNGADVILLLYHNSTVNLEFDYAYHVNGIFGGHNHAFEQSVIGKSPALQASAYGRGVSHIRINYDFDNKKVASSYGENITNKVLKAYVEDRGTNELINYFAPMINQIKNEKVAFLPRSIGDEEVVTLMEQYMYKYYVEELNNPHTLYAVRHNQARQYLPSGYVTYGDIYAAFPFDNSLVLAKSYYEYADMHAYTSYYPNGNDPSSLKDDNGDVYLLTINYLSEHETYGEYLTPVTTYSGMYPRDIMKMYLGNEYPLP